MNGAARTWAWLATALLLVALPVGARAEGEAAAGPVDWESWKPDNNTEDLASVQRGARNFMQYCNGCHSLKYLRYQRMGEDLKIADKQLDSLVPPGHNKLEYIGTAMPATDAVDWFGKAPPDLSVIARYRGTEYLYQFLKTFYADPTRASGSNNLAYPATAMPAVLSDLGGVKGAVFKDQKNADGSVEKVFDHFETISAGTLSAKDYDDFVRDTVNFLDYASEPAQNWRRSVGIWVVLFLLVGTGLSYLLKKEYWKSVR